MIYYTGDFQGDFCRQGLVFTDVSYNLGHNPWYQSTQIDARSQNKLHHPLSPSSMLQTVAKQLLVCYHDTINLNIEWGEWGVKKRTMIL